ncbi:hypothetical protein [Segatella maculosa]|uniref:hypothetical protein n=1 Tax=Segatella maculosa TaxID=439703 RepID=UPI000380C16E|nr:hypothetical protein [Segatella maculosa]
MGNSTSNTRRNVIRGIVALIIILIILLCLRLCKHDKEEVPTPQPPPSASTPQDTIKQDTTTVFPKTWQKVSKPKRKRKVIAASVLQPAKEVAVQEKKKTPQEQPKQQAIIEPEPDDIVIDTAETIREPKPKRVFSHKHYYQTRIGIRVGVGYSVIGNLGALVEDGAIRPRYTMEESGALVPSIGVFALWRHDRLGVELAADYTWLSSTLKEHKQIGNIDEKTIFRYHVIMPQVAARLYLLSDLYMGVGVGMSIPLNPGGIDFSSNRTAMFASVDELTREHLRETLRARLHVMPLLKIGYSSFKNGIEASLQYGYGFMDLIKTNENPYGYHKATNNSHLLLLTVGYTIPLTKQK